MWGPIESVYSIARPGVGMQRQIELLRVDLAEARVLRCQLRCGGWWRITGRLKGELLSQTWYSTGLLPVGGAGLRTRQGAREVAQRRDGRARGRASWVEPGRARGSAPGRRETRGDAESCSSTASSRASQGRCGAARDAGRRGAGEWDGSADELLEWGGGKRQENLYRWA